MFSTLSIMIADSTFCTEDFMAACDSLPLPFLIMMQEDDTGAQTMYKLHRDLLRWNFDHRILGHGLTFGISENGHSVFGPNSKNPDRTAHFAVFYNATQAFSLTKDFIDNLDQKMDALKEDIESFAAKERGRARTSGSTNAIESSTDILSRDAFIQQARKKLDAAGVRVPEGYESYLSIEYNFEEGKYNIVENSAAIRKTCNSYGYYCLVTSQEQTAQEALEWYALRGPSEKVYASAKSEIGSDASQDSGSGGFHGKLLSYFIAMIIWNRIEYECSHYKSKSENVLDANAFIAGLDSISYKRSGAVYRYAGQASPVQLEILSRYGISEEMLRQLGNLVNARNQDKLIGQLSQAARTIPETAAAPKGKPDASGTANAKEPSRDQPKPRGRPKGSKNKKTLEKEAQLAEENRRRVEAGLPPWNPHPGRGRISGSKNKR